MLRRVALAGMTVAGLMAAGFATHAQARQSLLVLVTSSNPMVQTMAMLLTREALSRQTPVRMVLCGGGGDLAFGTYAGPAFKPSGLTAQQMMQGLIKDGAQVRICPLYLANTPGAAPQAMIEGVAATTPAEVGAFMAEPETRYVSF